MLLRGLKVPLAPGEAVLLDVPGGAVPPAVD